MLPMLDTMAGYACWILRMFMLAGYAVYARVAMLDITGWLCWFCCVLKMAMLPGYARYVGWLAMLGMLARVAG